MKNLLIFICIFCLSFSFVNDFSTAKVEVEEGINIFIWAKPAKDYKSLGRVKMPKLSWSGTLRETVNVAIKKTKKEYPTANGIIFDEEMNKCEAVLIE